MSDVHMAVTRSAVPQPGATLWYCNHCSALVSIQSSQTVHDAICPACVEAPLEFCGRFTGIPGVQFGDA